VASEIGVTVHTVYGWMKRGLLPEAKKVSGKWSFVFRSDMPAILARMSARPGSGRLPGQRNGVSYRETFAALNKLAYLVEQYWHVEDLAELHGTPEAYREKKSLRSRLEEMVDAILRSSGNRIDEDSTTEVQEVCK
jgi:hypothetical protein